jgi:signal transduction histidine kinase
MTVAQRLYLLVFVAVLGLVGLAGLGYYQIERVFNSANFGNVNSIPSLKTLDNLRSNFLLTRIDVRKYIQSVDSAQTAEIETRLKGSRDGVTKAIKQYLAPDGCLGAACAADDKDKDYLKEIESLWVEYDAKLDAILMESRKGESGMAKVTDMMDVNTPLGEKITAVITADFDYNMELSKNAADEAVATKASAIKVSILITVLVVAIVSTMGFLIVRNLLRQLGGEPAYVTEIAKQVAGGNLAVKVELKPGDTTSMLSSIHATIGTLAERTLKLEIANKELQAFSYSVSHDLRAPLRHIDGYIDLLVSRCRDGLSDKGVHYVDSIAAAARRMGVLIDDLLQFSRTGRAELHRESLDMNLALQDALTPIKESGAGRNIEWVIGDLPSVLGDYALLRQVWANLLENAAKFTRHRGAARIEVSARAGNGEITFVVADNGVGFDMQYVGKLFGVFQRLHSQEEFEGTGIGLANVQRIIARHGGRVWAEAELDRGATFYFTLPTIKEINHV